MSKWGDPNDLVEICDNGCFRITLFEVKGSPADIEDFGTYYDHEPADYCCGHYMFEAAKVNSRVLKKYEITAEEYEKIIAHISDTLPSGGCGLCE